MVTRVRKRGWKMRERSELRRGGHGAGCTVGSCWSVVEEDHAIDDSGFKVRGEVNERRRR